MTRLGAAFWIGLVLASGFTTFEVKHAVQEIDDELTRVRKRAVAEQQELRVLTAEWAHLNQPERLAELNANFLRMTPVTAKQLQQRIEDIAWRAPAVAPEVLVAAKVPAGNPAAASPAAATVMPSQPGRPHGAPPVADASAGKPPVSNPVAANPVAAIHPAPEPPAVAVAAATPPQGRPPGQRRIREVPDEAASALADALRVLGGARASTPPLRLAKAGPSSLDALIARIAETR